MCYDMNVTIKSTEHAVLCLWWLYLDKWQDEEDIKLTYRSTFTMNVKMSINQNIIKHVPCNIYLLLHFCSKIPVVTWIIVPQGTVLNSWKVVWVVLSEDGVEFYKKKTDSSPKGMIPLKGSTLISPCQDFSKRTVRKLLM